jgi:hypothetical protein
VSDPERHLATYGAWNPVTFFSLASETNRTVVTVAVRSAAGSLVENTRIDAVVRRIWEGVIAALPGVVGHRLLWSEVLFFAPTAMVEDVVRAISPLTSPPGAQLHVRAAIQLAPQDPTLRSSFCDGLGSGLAKVEYRKTYPDAWCIFDGVVVHVPS